MISENSTFRNRQIFNKTIYTGDSGENACSWAIHSGSLILDPIDID